MDFQHVSLQICKFICEFKNGVNDETLVSRTGDSPSESSHKRQTLQLMNSEPPVEPELLSFTLCVQVV